MSKTMNSIFRMVLCLVGAILFLNGFILSTLINFNIGLVFVILLGLLTFFIGLYFNRIRYWCQKGWKRLLLWALVAGYIGFLLASFMLAFYGEINTVTYKEEALIVLGAGIRGETVTMPLKYRLDSAVDYHHKNPEALIVVSGGQGADESISEALAMERYLLKKGVSADKIIKEEASTSTYENFVFSKKILDRLPNKRQNGQVAFVSNGFHLFRAQQIGTLAGFKLTHKTAALDWYMWPVVYVREVLAVSKFMVLGP